MSFSRSLTTLVMTGLVTSATIAYYIRVWRRRTTSSVCKENHRDKLPHDLDTWRIPGAGDFESEDQIWQDLDQVFRDGGYTLWLHAFAASIKSPGGTLPLSSGFAYATSHRGIGDGEGSSAGTMREMAYYNYINPLTRMARTPEGHDVAVRVIVVKNEGHEHLNILRRIARQPNSLFSNNHTLPMFAEFQYQDIIFGIFPKVGGKLDDAYDFWAKNSVGDIVDMILQALEGLAFIHELKVAHRDAFRDNFLIQWHSESMRTMTLPISRPRVYLIDFEMAIEFPSAYTSEQCVCTGLPLCGSIPEPEMNSRPPAPEMTTGEAYDPFKTDVWQLGKSFSDFRSRIPDIDDILQDMVNSNILSRPSAQEALEKLRNVVNSISPQSLLIEPEVLKDIF